jgi:predicted nucleotidyltransferase
MVSDAEREIIIRRARKYGASRVYLFGSCAQSEGDYRDIDVAVEDIPPRQFLRFYAEVLRQLHKPVDLLDLSGTYSSSKGGYRRR